MTNLAFDQNVEKNEEGLQDFVNDIQENIKSGVKLLSNKIRNERKTATKRSNIDLELSKIYIDHLKGRSYNLRSADIFLKLTRMFDLNPVNWLEKGGKTIFDKNNPYYTPNNTLIFLDQVRNTVALYMYNNKLKCVDFADTLHVTHSRISKLMHHNQDNMYLDFLIRFCYYTDSSFSVFFKQKDNSINGDIVNLLSKKDKGRGRLKNREGKGYKLTNDDIYAFLAYKFEIDKDKVKEMIEIYDKLISI